MNNFWKYRKAEKGETTCNDCIWSRERWWSNRIECSIHHNYAVAKNGTCGDAEKEKKTIVGQ